jgi:hypothetical protein
VTLFPFHISQLLLTFLYSNYYRFSNVRVWFFSLTQSYFLNLVLALLHTKNILDTAMNLLGVVQLETFQLSAKLAISKLNSYTAQIAQKDVPSEFYQAGPKDFS